MKQTDILVVSPLFFLRPAIQGATAVDALHNQQFLRVAAEIFDVFNYFLEPITVARALQQGIPEEVIVAARNSGLLISPDEPEFDAALLWEINKWSRAAHLLFTQQDLAYTEPVDNELSQSDLIAFRRGIMRSYLADCPYPDRYVAPAVHVVGLPHAELPDEPDLDALLSRRSVRSFGCAPVSKEAFASVLFESTHNVRRAEESKKLGDPYYLLNSFYSWLHLFVVVQGVEGVERGIYQYDANRHELRAVCTDVLDSEILPCIHYQDWIGGAGFCVFFTVQWDRYGWVYRHSRAYVNLLIQLGEIGQEVLQSSYRWGMVGWPTPALHETNSSVLLSLPTCHLDAMYFMKIGPPQ